MKTKAAIIANFASRVIIAGANLAVLLLSARWLGPAARGDISLFVLDLSLIMLVSEMVGGPALVYQVPRINNLQLKSLGYGWGLISALLCLFVLYFFSLIPAHAGFFLIFSGMLLNAGAVHSQILVGRGRFWSFSFLSMISPLSILGFIIFSLHYDEKKVEIVYNGILTGAILSFIAGALLTPGTWSKKPVPWLKLIPEVFYNGGLNQSASIFHLLSNRFSYFLLQRQYGNAELGVYSLAVSVCESVLMFSHSLSMVFYSRSANRSDDEGLRRGTAAWAGWSFFITLCGCLVLCLMPGAWIQRGIILFFRSFLTGIVHLLFPAHHSLFFRAGQLQAECRSRFNRSRCFHCFLLSSYSLHRYVRSSAGLCFGSTGHVYFLCEQISFAYFVEYL
jgi:O-antigen/teichoic acid export membrane protein